MENNQNISNSKVASSFLWVFIEKFGYSGISLLSTLILGRLLTPYEFGLVGSIAIITSISNMIIDSGLGAALINKKNPTRKDYNTVFTFNFLASVFLYVIIFMVAPFIADYFKAPILKDLIRLLSTTLIFNSFTLIQRVVLMKKLLFKKQSFIAIVSVSFSAGIAILVAYKGWGVWAIAIQTVLYAVVYSIGMIFSIRYIPKLEFSSSSFRELLGFGGRIVLSGAIQVGYSDIISSVIAKVHTIQITGLYAQSQKLVSFPVYFFRSLFDSAAFPILSKAKNKYEFKKMCSQINRGIYFLSFPILLVLPFNTTEVIQITLGEKWLPADKIFTILSIGIVISLIDMAAFSTLKSAGEAKTLLNIGLSKAIIGLSFLSTTILFSIDILLYGILLTNLITGFIAIYYIHILTLYKIKEQLRDIVKPLCIAVAANTVAFIISRFVHFDYLIINLLIFIIIMAIVFVILCLSLKVNELNFIVKKLKKK